ncbi:hypothetical protein RJ639_047721 [Escallonia herrerae]|uniref:Protein WUSCHEL n=1 Tax=Escallonia herrerae TaxID=1293975 RepID=A0AA89B366_9ASTE|nr:hypothetical protein RJ639_047721 [Escallonia herrerae]
MASSNRHWPSMFKSKPCSTHHQWQRDINPTSLVSTGGCHRVPYASVTGSEERSPEPKPRWNPKPEQIRILEAIFNSGMVNPPRDEIRKIRAQLQEYGQVGDANVFYWFQNRKSRSKHKNRHLQTTKSAATPTTVAAATTAAPSSSSSSSEKSKSSPKAAANATGVDALNSPTASVNQPFYQAHAGEFLPEPFFFPVHQQQQPGFYFPECAVVDQTVGSSSGFLLTDLMMNHVSSSKKIEDEKMKLQQLLGYTVSTVPASTSSIVPPTTLTVPPTISHIQGLGEAGGLGPAKSTVFINDVAFEVAVGPFSVREAFGDDSVLIHSSGQPVLTNGWGVTLHPLQHGAFYYLVRTLTASDDTTIDLVLLH